MSTIGQVDVTFPLTGVNLTICHPTYGTKVNSTIKGVTVIFYTELGDLPMLDIRDGSGNYIQVYMYIYGLSVCVGRG
jgi:hypothetical protein